MLLVHVEDAVLIDSEDSVLPLALLVDLDHVELLVVEGLELVEGALVVFVVDGVVLDGLFDSVLVLLVD